MARRPEPPTEGEVTHEGPLPPGVTVTTDETTLDDLSVDELKAEADRVGATPEGSGKDGRVLKDDLIDAIDAIPEPPVGRPPLGLVAESAAPRNLNSED
jgi:hypothetical protein